MIYDYVSITSKIRVLVGGKGSQVPELALMTRSSMSVIFSSE